MVCQLRSDVIYGPVVQKVDNSNHQVKISIHWIAQLVFLTLIHRLVIGALCSKFPSIHVCFMWDFPLSQFGGGGGGGGGCGHCRFAYRSCGDVLRTKTKHVSFIFRALNCLKLVCQLRSDVIYAPVVQKVDNAIHQVKISIHGI